MPTPRKLGLAGVLVLMLAFALGAFASEARAAYLTLGTGNTSDATTTLSGSIAGPELKVQNANGNSAGAFGLYALLSAPSPTANAAALRGHNSSTNAHGYGVWGSQAGSGTGVYGSTPSGRGVWGNSSSGTGLYGSSSSGTGARGQSSSGLGVVGLHTSTSGNLAGVEGLTNSSAADASAVRGVNASTHATGLAGYGVWGTYAGYGTGVFGSAPSGFSVGVQGASPVTGVIGRTGTSTPYTGGVLHSVGVWGQGGSNAVGVNGTSGSYIGVFGQSSSGTGVSGYSSSGYGVYGESSSSYAGWFQGNVNITGTLTSGVKDFKIDDPLDPAHKYLLHTSVESSDMMDIYTGTVTTNGRGFATVTMPRWFQALNRTFRYQLTVIGKAHWDAKAAIWNEIEDNRFTVRTDQPNVKVSWQVTGIRHDRYANAHRTQVVVPKAKAEQGKYLHPELYGKPKSDAIGYQKPRAVPRRTLHPR